MMARRRHARRVTGYEPAEAARRPVIAVREGRVAASAAGCSARIRPGCSARSRPPEGISPLLSATALLRHAVTGYARPAAAAPAAPAVRLREPSGGVDTSFELGYFAAVRAASCYLRRGRSQWVNRAARSSSSSPRPARPSEAAVHAAAGGGAAADTAGVRGGAAEVLLRRARWELLTATSTQQHHYALPRVAEQRNRLLPRVYRSLTAGGARISAVKLGVGRSLLCEGC